VAAINANIIKGARTAFRPSSRIRAFTVELVLIGRKGHRAISRNRSLPDPPPPHRLEQVPTAAEAGKIW